MGSLRTESGNDQYPQVDLLQSKGIWLQRKNDLMMIFKNRAIGGLILPVDLLGVWLDGFVFFFFIEFYGLCLIYNYSVDP